MSIKKTTAKPKKTVGKKTLPAEKKLEEISERTRDEKYAFQKYPKGGEVPIPGALFADFINNGTMSQQYLEQMRKNLSLALQTIDLILAKNDVITLAIMDQHMKNVDGGFTERATDEEIAAFYGEEVPEATTEQASMSVESDQPITKKSNKK